jgi:tetratricopeptide (TPR) repeat protein
VRLVRSTHSKFAGGRGVLLCIAWWVVAPWTCLSADHLRQALDLISRGDLNAAEKEVKFALSDPSTEAIAWAILGAIRLQEEKYDRSIECLNKALHLDPRLVGARVNLGNVYLLQGKKDQARESFHQALSIDPSNYNARLNLAQLEAEKGNYKASLEASQPISTRLRESPEGVLLLANNYLGLQQRDFARALISDWKRLKEVPPTLAVDLAALLIKNDLSEEAIVVLEKAVAVGQTSFELLFDLAGCYLSRGELRRASENYEHALTLNAYCAACYQQIAKIARTQGETEKALAYLLKAKGIEPGNPEILFDFGKVCLERSLFDDALASLQKAVELRPENESYVYVLASANVGKKQFDVARSLLNNLLKKRPEDPVLNYAMGAVFLLEMNLDDATRYYENSLRSDPTQLASSYYLGVVAERKGELDHATRIFRDLLRRYPEHGPTYEALGGALLKQQQYIEAQQMLEKAVQLNPNSTKANYQLGMVLLRRGEKEEAAKYLEISKKLGEEERVKSSLELRLLNPNEISDP